LGRVTSVRCSPPGVYDRCARLTRCRHPLSAPSDSLPLGVPSARRSDSSVRRSLRAVSTTTRCSVVRSVPHVRGRTGSASHRLGSPTGPCAGSVPGSQGSRTSPPGVLPPLQRHKCAGPLYPGLPHPARSALGVSHPLDGFLPARSAVHKGPLPLLGFGGLPPIRCAPPERSAEASRSRSNALIGTWCDPSSSSEEQEVECPGTRVRAATPPSAAPEGAARGGDLRESTSSPARSGASRSTRQQVVRSVTSPPS